MKEYQEIRDTSPLGLKMLNDQLRLLWFKAKNTTTKDIRNGAVTLNKLASDVGQSLDLSSNTSISLKIAEGLNSLEIGGRNLIPNSQSVRMMSNNSATYPIEDEAYGDHRRCRRTFPAGVTSQSLSTYTTFFYNTEKGSIYTISLKVKPEADVVLRLASYGTNTLCKAGEWTTLSTTFTATVDESRRYMGIYGKGFSSSFMPWIEYKDAKAEKGNKATDWSPAPEDIVKKDKLITEINLTSDTAKIQANKIDLVGAVTVLSDITGNLGTITAGTINGIKINGTTITGGTIKVTGESSSLGDLPFIVDRADGFSRFGIGGSRIMGECDGKITFQIANVFKSGAILNLPNTNDDKLSITLNAPIGQVSADSFVSRDVYIGDSDPTYLCGLRGDFDIEKIKTGTCNINTTTWKSFSFNDFMSPVPRVVLTSADGVSGISNGKVRNITNTGFEAMLGGSGYNASTHHYIAISGEG